MDSHTNEKLLFLQHWGQVYPLRLLKSAKKDLNVYPHLLRYVRMKINTSERTHRTICPMMNWTNFQMILRKCVCVCVRVQTT